jgi:uncharacterized RmlC-like cupin family protein
MEKPTAGVHRSPANVQFATDDEKTVMAMIYKPAVAVRALSAGRMRVPGGRSTKPLAHATSETMLAVLSGYSAVVSGWQLETVKAQPGDMVYVAPKLPYAVINLSLNASVLLLVFRTDPAFFDDASYVPRLDSIMDAKSAQLRREHLNRLMSRRSAKIRRRR